MRLHLAGLAFVVAVGAHAPGRAEARWAASAAPPSQPATTILRVRLVATGGTISNRAGGRLTAEELVKSMPGIERYVRAQREAENYTAMKGLVIVTTTRTGSGRIAPRGGAPRPNASGPLTPDEQRRFVAGEDVAPVKARVLLMLALTRTSDPAEIQRMFSEY